MRATILMAVVIAALGTSAHAADPVKTISVYVEPFYNAPRAPGDARRVAVGKRYDAQLASENKADILAVRDAIKADPKVVTPMTMMVLAVRLYEVGERDEAALWFYAAKDRMMVLLEVAQPNTPQLAQATQAVGAFSQLAGPAINGYAFCDIKNQQAIRARALDWVAANPYEVMFMSQIPSRPGDRQALAAAGLKLARENAGKEKAYFEDAKNREGFLASRKQNEMDAKYCWR